MHLLKEWNSVCRALEEGRQILLARKGGILDDDLRFIPAHREFFLYPTFLHQAEQLKAALKPSEIARIDASEASAPIRLFCRMTDAKIVTDLSRLRALEPEHIFSERLLEERMSGGREKGLTILIVRVFRLDMELILPPDPSYAGCKSWIEAPGEATLPCSPVLSDDAFLTKRETILTALS
jgi:hypothetical protein